MSTPSDAARWTPSAVRNRLEVRVRRLSRRIPVRARRRALQEIIDIAAQAVDRLPDDEVGDDA